mmetsp:Transcript_100113/g.298794  ORF Transcript_100113/g.298794 Transcript_100113/m.298794 type:complete len:279 (-) Transcript_100113:659-1495(-)
MGQGRGDHRARPIRTSRTGRVGDPQAWRYPTAAAGAPGHRPRCCGRSRGARQRAWRAARGAGSSSRPRSTPPLRARLAACRGRAEQAGGTRSMPWATATEDAGWQSRGASPSCSLPPRESRQSDASRRICKRRGSPGCCCCRCMPGTRQSAPADPRSQLLSGGRCCRSSPSTSAHGPPRPRARGRCHSANAGSRHQKCLLARTRSGEHWRRSGAKSDSPWASFSCRRAPSASRCSGRCTGTGSSALHPPVRGWRRRSWNLSGCRGSPPLAGLTGTPCS